MILWKILYQLYGGDLRIVRLAQLLSEDNTVFIYGQEKYFNVHQEEINNKIIICNSLDECIRNSDTVISGVPLTRDNITVTSPYSDEIIELERIYQKLENKKFIAGGIPTWFYDNNKIKNVDLLQSEELTILNAIPTVEGTIKIAIEETEETIHENNVLIYGFGRIGKILCQRFCDLGANVYCVARKNEDFAWIREYRCIPIKYEEVEKYVEKINIIINTVPVIVINENIIKKLKKDCLIIDVASNPGGVDKDAIKRYNIRVITALGIPGKIAPKTAAKYIKEIIQKN